MTSRLLVPLALGALLLTGCSEAAQDRSEAGGGPRADAYRDASQVVVWRSPDDVPNVVLLCADGLRFATTLSRDGGAAPQLLRVPEQDQRCQQ